MSRRRCRFSGAAPGYALLSVVVFALVVTLAAAAIFTVSAYETKGAIYRQNSSAAFYLADGAIERGRARFLSDRGWREGWSGIAAGDGTYDLAISDTTLAGGVAGVRLTATGHVGGAQRRVELLAEVPPRAYDLALLICGNASVNGNFCLTGTAHVNGSGWNFGSKLKCGGTVTHDYTIVPPAARTEPAFFPNATYYYVRGCAVGGIYHARVLNGAGQDITTALHDSLTSVISYRSGDATFVYNFGSHTLINRYFNDATGVFRRETGKTAVVVNFGERPVMMLPFSLSGGMSKLGAAPVPPPSVDAVAEVIFTGSSSSIVNSTVINTRFSGASEAERVNPDRWTGGLLVAKRVEFRPYYGIAVIAARFERQGSSQVTFGTATYPALVYVTKSVERITANFALRGSLICLGNWSSAGSVTVTYDGSFATRLPSYFDSYESGGSGSVEVVRWREIAAPTGM